jgi:autotransporter-associated beta strand protein
LTLIGTNTLNNGATGNATKGLTIVPYLIGDNSSTTTGSHFVTYDTTLGLRLLTSAQETGLAPGYTTAAAPDNALAGNNVTVTNAAGITINSLLFNTLSVNSTLISANPNPLTINSGAMASVVNQQNGIEGFSSLNFGNGEAVITVTSNTLTVSSPINVTSSGGLTKSGNGALLLRANNLYLGATIINAGTLRVGDGAVGTLNAASVVTINPQGTLQINRPTGDTFANAIVHNGTLTVSTVGTQTLSGNISGVGAINASTAGNTLVLSGTNSYSGGSNVTAGVLQFNAAASIAGSGRNLSISGTGVAAAGYAIDQAFLDRIVTTSGGTAALATNSANNLDFTGLATTSLGATGAFTYTGTLTPDGTNYRVGGGAGVLTFSNANAFTGGSNVLNVVNGIVALTATNNYGGRTNLLSGGILRIGVADALPTGTTLSFGNGTTFGATTIGNLDVQFNQTVAGLLANTNSASANTISIAQNRTLTINGAFTVGGYTGTGSPTTVLNITGDGALMVNGDFRTNAGTDGSYLTTVDLGGLASFTATGANFLIGDTSSGVASQATSSVKLGAGTNTINTTTLALGHVKGSGAMTFSGPTGTLKVRGLDGQNVTPVTNFNVVNVTTATAASPVGTADFDGHQVDILATNLTIGNRAFAGGGAGQVSSATGTFSFNNGVVETVNLTMAQRSHSNTNAGSGNVTGELNVGGSLTATALLKVTGSTFSIGRNTATAGGIAIGTVNVLTNGTLETDANIVDTGGAGVTTTTINLNGGTLNLKGKTIGDATTPIDNLTFAAGTLANVAQINNGAAINKTTAGMLTLSGTNTFTGLTSVQAGTLKVDGTTTGAVTVDTGATLAGTGTISGVVTVNGTLAPGESLGRLTVANDVTFGSGATFAAGINGLSAGTTHDQLTIDGDFDITLGNASLLLTMGTFGVTVGQQIVLIDSNGPGSVIGQFAGLGEGAQIASLDGINGFNWNITYANDVAIVATAVPEPAGLGLIALAAAGMLRRRRVR